MQTTQTVWQTRSVAKRRTFERCNAWVHARLHFGNHAQTVVIRDVSQGGMKIEYAYGLTPGDKVTIEIDASRALDATVDWPVATYCGIEFDTPLAEGDPLLISCKVN